MIYKIPELIAYISRFFTLQRGDLILTGTPAGVNQLNDGDEVEIEIEALGKLRNYVKNK